MNFNERKEAAKELIAIIKENSKPAVGCTEPVAVALAASNARKYWEESDDSIKTIEVQVSKNIFKNGKSVTIPNTNECGVDIAAAIGVLCGDADAALGVFRNVDEVHTKKACNMVHEGMVKVQPLYDTEPVYVKVILSGDNEKVACLIRGSHSNIDTIEKNGKIIFKKDEEAAATSTHDLFKTLTFEDLKAITEEIPMEDISFVAEGIDMNKNAAHEGLKKNKDKLGWGYSLLKLQKEGKIGSDPSTKARILTAAGADLRMSGGNCAIMTSGGSGNQGLCVILPVVVVGEDINASEERIQRAVFLGHAVNNFVKGYTGKLTAMCGCAIAAGIGATTAITWLLGGDETQMEGSVQNMLANLTGMICDGAKESCAIKLSTSAAEAVIGAYIAMDNTIVPSKTGILGKTVENTIANLGELCNKGFKEVDEVMIDIACRN